LIQGARGTTNSIGVSVPQLSHAVSPVLIDAFKGGVKVEAGRLPERNSNDMPFCCCRSCHRFDDAHRGVGGQPYGQQMTRNWKVADQCAAGAQKTVPDHTSESNAKRDALLKQYLSGHNLPPRGDLDTPTPKP
jgi:hypothetical protein